LSHHVSHIPAQTKEASKESWFPRPDEDHRRPCSIVSSSQQRSRSCCRLVIRLVIFALMLSRSQRLSTKQFNVVMEKGRVAHSPLFLARILPLAGEPTRIAAVVPNKVSKTAAGRNSLRRKIYEAIRPFYPGMVSGFHLILFAKNTALNRSVAEIKADLQKFFVKAALLR